MVIASVVKQVRYTYICTRVYVWSFEVKCTNEKSEAMNIYARYTQGFLKLTKSCSHFPKILLTSADLNSRL